MPSERTPAFNHLPIRRTTTPSTTRLRSTLWGSVRTRARLPWPLTAGQERASGPLMQTTQWSVGVGGNEPTRTSNFSPRVIAGQLDLSIIAMDFPLSSDCLCSRTLRPVANIAVTSIDGRRRKSTDGPSFANPVGPSDGLVGLEPKTLRRPSVTPTVEAGFSAGTVLA